MTYDLWVDFSRLQDDGLLLAQTRNAREGAIIAPGGHLVVGCEDADSAVAQVLAMTAGGSIELRVLPGAVEDHGHLLHPDR